MNDFGRRPYDDEPDSGLSRDHSDVPLGDEEEGDFRVSWRQHAACLGLDNSIFFEEGDPQTAEAKRVCGECFVLAVCRGWAIKKKIPLGVWGGMTPVERKAEGRRRSMRPGRHEE